MDNVQIFLPNGEMLSFESVTDLKVQGVNGTNEKPATYHRIEFDHNGRHVEYLTNATFLIARVKE